MSTVTKATDKGSVTRTYEALENSASAAARDLGKSQKTIATYQGHLKRLRKFLRTFSQHEQDQEKTYQSHLQQSAEPQDEIEDESDDPLDSLGPIEMPIDFPEALDGPPKECTPSAIRMFLYQKCFIENCGAAVADQIHAAAIWYYDEMDGDTYQGHWRFDAATNRWIGNPGRGAKVESLLKAIKNKNGEKERKHSRAISMEDMEQLHEHRIRRMEELSEKKDSKSRAERARLAMFGAFSTLAFTLWTRNAETTELTAENFDFSPPPKRSSNGQAYPYFVVSLRNRKNWQRKQKKGETQLNGHVYYYNIYSKPQNPAIDAYSHILEWKQIYETELLGRPLNGTELMFPTIDANALPHTHEAIGSHTVQKLINELAAAAGISGAGMFTTHCFQRGGAQYRFMFAPLSQCWTLARIRWWGGWTLKEKGDTLVRYLLDELSTYEDDHRDALCPFNESENESSSKARPLTAAEGHEIMAAFHKNSRVLRDLSTQVSAFRNIAPVITTGSPTVHCGFNRTLPAYPQLQMLPLNAPGDNTYIHTPQSQLPSAQPAAQSVTVLHSPQVYTYRTRISPIQHPSAVFPQRDYNHRYIETTPHSYDSHTLKTNLPSSPLGSGNGPYHTAAFFAAPQLPTPDQRVAIDRSTAHHPIPYSSRSRKNAPSSWMQIVHDWEHSSPGCPIPLKDFDLRWCTESGQRQKYHIRRVIASEYIDSYHRDNTAFCAAYPAHERGITPLYKAILAARQKAGTAKVRAKKYDHSHV